MSTIRVIQLEGLTPYDTAHELQLRAVEARKAKRIGDTLFLVEHTAVITLGRNADSGGVIADNAHLERMGIGVRRIERGGQATYHGPGQVVGYPIIDLEERRLGIKEYVRRLEQTMMLACRKLNVETMRKEGITGVFTERGKIGAVGVRVTQGVSFHGFALNICPDLTHYRLIIPCGMSEIPVTSAEEITGAPQDMGRAEAAVLEAFGAVFEVETTVPVRTKCAALLDRWQRAPD